jgi:hypothetical protein
MSCEISGAAIEMAAEEIWESFYQIDTDTWEDYQGAHRDRLLRFAKRILEQANRINEQEASK